VNKSASGRTLVELMVSSAILLMLTGACAAALRASLDYHQRVQQQSQIEEDLLRAIGSLTRELGESSPRAVHWQAAPIALTFPTPRDDDGALIIDHAAGNRIRWQTLLSYRLEGADKELKRYVDRLPALEISAPNPLDLTPPRDDAYFAAAGREYKTLARGVTDFNLTAVAIDDYDESQTVVTDLSEADLIKVFIRIEQGVDMKYAVSSEVGIVPSN
jgi:type II secretory pathway pseudopilin PulG